eukprot:7701865-Pyramimonas_sp.AAC.1
MERVYGGGQWCEQWCWPREQAVAGEAVAAGSGASLREQAVAGSGASSGASLREQAAAGSGAS